jgi:predicted nucleic acid-binding protein
LDQSGDFEDALLMTCASRQNRLDYIVTRDKELQKTAWPVPVVSPSRLLEILKTGDS